MAHIPLKLSFPCIAFFTVVVLFFHANSYDDPRLRTLLMPPAGCSAPCFMGIRLGVTTLTEGIEQLQANPIIQSISPVASESSSPLPVGLYYVEFVSALTPIRTAQMQFLTNSRSDVVEGIYLFDAGIRLSDILMTFGQPTSLILDDRFHTGIVTYIGYYSAYQIYIQMLLPVCSSETGANWEMQQDVVIGVETPQRRDQGIDPPARVKDEGDGWLQRLHHLKRATCV